MKAITRFAVLPFVLVAFGCKGGDSKATDAALNSDLSLASQAHPMTAADSVSAIERARMNSVATKPAAAGPVEVTHRTVVHHVYQGGSSTGRSSGSHIEKNTNRDAAIGAGAGAILGAVTSKDKLKGGVIGGIAGGVLGGVFGNNVDKKRVPNP